MLITEPNIATEMPAVMIVFTFAPIHTMRSGASADFGRLFRTTRYGSITAEKRGKSHKSTANAMPSVETSRKLIPERKEKVGEMMETYGLKSFSNARPSELSGGMRQRAALIRTLAMEPDLLLLDEPFSALDYQTRLNVCDDIGKIIKKEGKTAILVTHDISEAISMADRVIVLAARPAYVKKKIPIQFAMEERTPMKARSAPEFKTYFNAIWKELNENA